MLDENVLWSSQKWGMLISIAFQKYAPKRNYSKYVTCSGESVNKSERLESDFGINIPIYSSNQPWMEGKF